MTELERILKELRENIEILQGIANHETHQARKYKILYGAATKRECMYKAQFWSMALCAAASWIFSWVMT